MSVAAVGTNGEGVAHRREEDPADSADEVQGGGVEENEVQIDAQMLLKAIDFGEAVAHDVSNTRGSEGHSMRTVEDHASIPGSRLEEARDAHRVVDGSTRDGSVEEDGSIHMRFFVVKCEGANCHFCCLFVALIGAQVLD